MKNKNHSGGRECDHGPSDVENESIGNRKDEFDLHQALINRMIMKMINIEERNEENVETEEGSAELLQPLVEEVSELRTEEKKIDTFTCFTRVLGTKEKSDLLKTPSIVVDAMNEMRLGKREKCSKQGVCKFNTLLGRHFNGSVKKSPLSRIVTNMMRTP